MDRRSRSPGTVGPILFGALLAAAAHVLLHPDAFLSMLIPALLP